MKIFLSSLVFLLVFAGCQSNTQKQAQHDAQVAKQARAELLAELKAKEERQLPDINQSKLSQFGITTIDGKIIIDTNKTKYFFKTMASKMKNKMETFSKNIDKGIIHEEKAGIEVEETYIHIDINKTKSFLENFTQKMQGFAKEFDTIAEMIEQNKKGN